MKILITSPSFLKTKAYERLRNKDNYQLLIATTGLPVPSEEIRDQLPGCHGYIAGLEKIDEWVLEKADTLKVISRYGVGCDHIDQNALRAKDIILTSTPGANAVSVAEFAFGLILGLGRHICKMNKQLKEGIWERIDGFELNGKTIGLIGLGAIGREVVRIAKGFNMKIVFFDPYVTQPEDQSILKLNSLKELIGISDVISFHTPLTEETKYSINKRNLSYIKPGALLINTARALLIEEEAVIEGLNSGLIGGFATDVYKVEPPGRSPLFELENVIVSPHAAPNTSEALEQIGDWTLEGLLSVLEPRFDADGSLICKFRRTD